MEKFEFDMVNVFECDIEDGHPGSGRAEIAFGTGRFDDGRVRDIMKMRKSPSIYTTHSLGRRQSMSS